MNLISFTSNIRCNSPGGSSQKLVLPSGCRGSRDRKGEFAKKVISLENKCSDSYLPCTLGGDRPPLSLPISSSTSKQRPLLLTLTSELALLLVARGESETLTVRLRAGPDPDLTLYIDDAGMFVINGLKLPGMVRLISICRMAISNDFFESVLPKPELSGEEDFPDRLLWGECLSSCLGGASFRMFITLSTILFPITTGLTLSLTLEYPRFTAGTEPPLACRPLGARPLEGEHDCRLILPGGPGSTEEDRELGAPGLPLVAESGLSGSDVLKFGGASREKPGISEGFHGLDFTVEEAPRDGAEFLETVELGLLTAGEGLTEEADIFGALDGVDGRRDGVVALDTGLDGGIEDLAVGVEDLAVDLEGVDDLDGIVDLVADEADLLLDTTGFAVVAGDLIVEAAGLGLETMGLFEETEGLVDGSVDLEVGVEGLEGLDAPVSVGRPVGVAGLEPGPPDEEGLRVPEPEEFNPVGVAGLEPGDGCFVTKLPRVTDSGWGFANLDFRAVGRAFGVPS